ncbi:Short C-terminal domain-containing protein [Streptomyces sp. Ag82_O1-12]|nr:Short C-terminal domain-containing protein [Streptomyces sp. Ag82_O1-12]SOD45046.1 Short C-terminal domain-containing protein [Streptomyces sp. Ag82_G6-1]
MPHTMSRMGDVLAGFHAAWEFESDSVCIRYERGIRAPKLFQALGERRVPLEAIAGVTLTRGRRGTVVLRVEPRPGADPLLEAAAGQLKENVDPYRLVLPADREVLAEYYADELRGLLTESGPADRFLVKPPEGPLSFKAYDGKATFDGRTVNFRWFWTGASSAKWKAGDQSFSVGELNGVEWRSPEVFEGHLRLLRRDAGVSGAQADQDPAAVVFGLGYGPVHESLPFAAAVLAAVRTSSPVAAVPAPRRDPADIAERIRHLGELHQAGLVTDEEFSVKKAELLAEL